MRLINSSQTMHKSNKPKEYSWLIWPIWFTDCQKALQSYGVARKKRRTD